MKRISAWFDRHPKTRIALQLVLDGLPFLLLAFPFTVGIIEVNCHISNLPYLLDVIATCCMESVMYGGSAVLYALGIWLRSRAKDKFERYPWCKAVSGMLRVLSFIPAVLSFGLLIGLLYYGFKNL